MTWGEQNTQEEGFEQMDYAVEKEIKDFEQLANITMHFPGP